MHNEVVEVVMEGQINSEEDDKGSVAERNFAQAIKRLVSQQPHRALLGLLFGVVFFIEGIPLVGDVIGEFFRIPLRGWRFQIVRRMARHEHPVLPDFGSFSEVMKNGLILFVIQSIYWLPHFILIFFFSDDWMSAGVQVADWGYSRFIAGQNTIPFFEMARSAVIGLLLVIPFHVAYWLISWPVYRIGMLRYAINDKPKSFFQIRKNAALLFQKNYAEIFKLMFQMFIVESIIGQLIGVFSSLLTKTWIGLPAAFLWPISYGVIGYLWGSVAQQLRQTGDLDG